MKFFFLIDSGRDSIFFGVENRAKAVIPDNRSYEPTATHSNIPILLHLNRFAHPMGNHSHEPTEVSPNVHFLLPQSTCLHPKDSHLHEPTATRSNVRKMQPLSKFFIPWTPIRVSPLQYF